MKYDLGGVGRQIKGGVTLIIMPFVFLFFSGLRFFLGWLARFYNAKLTGNTESICASLSTGHCQILARAYGQCAMLAHTVCDSSAHSSANKSHEEAFYILQC